MKAARESQGVGASVFIALTLSFMKFGAPAAGSRHRRSNAWRS
jgi:hypothetical protein